MFTKLRKITAVGALLLAGFSTSSYAVDEYSAARDVDRIQVVATAEQTYVTASPAGWGSAICPGATFILLTNSGGQYKNMLAMAMTAKAGGLKLRAYGECDAAGVYFDAKQLILE